MGQVGSMGFERFRWICAGTCALALCAAACGDDAASTGGSPDAGAAAAPDAAPVGDSDADAAVATGGEGCDLSGSWAVQRVGFAMAASPLVTGAQKSSRWYYLEIAQDGEALEVTRGLWCGDLTTGDATVRYSAETEAALRPLAGTDGRRGSSRESADGCTLELERIYWAYGVAPLEDFLPGAESPPGRIAAAPELADLPALPDAADDPAVVDVDADGNPGARSLITDTPVGSGVRHGLQRGWEDMAGETPRGARDFRVDIGYDFQEVALSAMPELFASGASVRKQAPHQARFLRVDADFAGSDDDATCASVQELLPHRPEPREDW